MELDSKTSRRDFVRMLVAGIGALYIPRWSWAFSNVHKPEADPHFFLQIFVQGGLDPSYFFDARPLEMTAAGKIQNYTGEDPQVWKGANGGQCLATKIMDPLLPFKDKFSILNGVVMSSSLDGHDQCENLMLTGDAFGGESFVPSFNRVGSQRKEEMPLDAIQSGTLFANLNNVSRIIPLSSASAAIIAEKLKKSKAFDLKSPLLNFLHARMEKNGGGKGRFSNGSLAMAEGFETSPIISERLLKASGDFKATTEEGKFVEMLGSFFLNGITRCGILSLAGNDLSNVDCHDAASAKKMPAMAKEVVTRVSNIFKGLQDTPYDANRSLLDVTTVMFASEFSRTMRITGSKIDETGTNHNALNNSIWLGGKGIRGGCVFGASDGTDAKMELSAAHKAVDSEMVKIMGKPFDFTNGIPKDDLPATYDATHYLNIASVMNTLFTSFDVPTAMHRSATRNGAPAPILKQLLI